MKPIPSYLYYSKRYLSVGLPILLTSLSPLFMAVADNAMVGYLGEEVRAASTFVNVITGTAFLLLIGISSVLMPLVAGAVVSGNYEKATKALKYSVLVSMLCGVVCVGILFAMEGFLDHMGQDPEVVRLARGGYFKIITTSILLNTVSQPLKRYLDGLGFRYTNMTLSFLSASMNVCLNYLLIQGRYGLPALGFNGAGVATLLTRFVIMICYILIVWSMRRWGYVKAFWAEAWDQRYFIKMLKLGLPSGFELAMKMLYLNVVNIMIGWMGVREQSSASILFALIRMGLLVPVAIGAAGSILLAEAWKKGRKSSIYTVRSAGYGMSIGLTCIIGTSLYRFFPSILDTVFDPTDEVKTLVLSLMGLAILFQITDGMTFVGTGLLRGIRDTFIPFVMTTCVSFCIGLPISYYLGFYTERGLYGIFQGVIIGLGLSAILLYMRFGYKTKTLGL